MPKRKRQRGEAPSRKSVRLAEKSRQPSSLTPRAQSEARLRTLPSPSTSGLAKTIHHQSPESNTRRSTNDTSFETAFAKTQSHTFQSAADRKRKHVKEPTQHNKRTRKSESELAPETNVPVNESLDSLEKELEVSKEDEGANHISYWAAHNTWPNNFAERGPMASSSNTGKRQRTSSYSQSGKDKKRPSYTQSRKDGAVPEQYTSEYERHIFTKGLDMDVLRGENLVSKQSKKSCIGLMKITRHTIKPTIFPKAHLRKVINLLGTRNEAIVNRDITPMIVPPLASLHLSGDHHLEHIVDEVNADWYKQCVLEGPQIRPDLAIGLFSSAFTRGEIDKLMRYKTVDNWTQFTGSMLFPTLMVEVKCGREGLDVADRQNMHSCCVAVRAILRIEQEADKYRTEPKLHRLSGQVLVFSISHDRQDVRLYGHFAIIHEERWTYYRYRIGTFNILTSQKDLLALYNFVQNVLKTHVPDHLERLQGALSAQPEPSALSVCASGMSLNDTSQQSSPERDPEGFAIPAIPDAARKGKMAKAKGQNDEMLEQVRKLMAQLEEERKTHEKEKQENRDQIEQLRQDGKEREKWLERQMEKQQREIVLLLKKSNE